MIVPALDEERRVGRCVRQVLAEEGVLECLVVDGGSRDRTVARARAAGAQVLLENRGQRAAQMNAGAGKARGQWLLFLHADTRLSRGSLAQFGDLRGVVGGAFARRFAGKSLFLSVTCRLADWRGRRLGIFLGDQAIFVRRDVFDRLGGFRNLDAMEDLDFSLRMRRLGRTVLLVPPVVTSARRFRGWGPVFQTLWDFARALGFLASRG